MGRIIGDVPAVESGCAGDNGAIRWGYAYKYSVHSLHTWCVTYDLYEMSLRISDSCE